MILDATCTNVITDILLSVVIFLCFVGGFIHYLRRDHRFSLWLVFFFLVLFLITSLGAYVHFYDSGLGLTPSWIAIGLLTIMLSYLLVHAIDMPIIFRIMTVFLSLAFLFLFLTHKAAFIFITFSYIISCLMAAFYSQSMLRFGFVMVVFSNVIWMIMRQAENYFIGHEISVQYRYDNDIYHLLSLLSIVIIYKAIVLGKCGSEIVQKQ